MRRLLRKIDENRERHDPEARPGYSCDVYGKNRLDLANAADYLDNRLVRKHLGFVLDYIDEEAAGDALTLPRVYTAQELKNKLLAEQASDDYFVGLATNNAYVVFDGEGNLATIQRFYVPWQ